MQLTRVVLGSLLAAVGADAIQSTRQGTKTISKSLVNKEFGVSEDGHKRKPIAKRKGIQKKPKIDPQAEAKKAKKALKQLEKQRKAEEKEKERQKRSKKEARAAKKLQKKRAEEAELQEKQEERKERQKKEKEDAKNTAEEKLDKTEDGKALKKKAPKKLQKEKAEKKKKDAEEPKKGPKKVAAKDPKEKSKKVTAAKDTEKDSKLPQKAPKKEKVVFNLPTNEPSKHLNPKLEEKAPEGAFFGVVQAPTQEIQQPVEELLKPNTMETKAPIQEILEEPRAFQPDALASDAQDAQHKEFELKRQQQAELERQKRVQEIEQKQLEAEAKAQEEKKKLLEKERLLKKEEDEIEKQAQEKLKEQAEVQRKKDAEERAREEARVQALQNKSAKKTVKKSVVPENVQQDNFQQEGPRFEQEYEQGGRPGTQYQQERPRGKTPFQERGLGREQTPRHRRQSVPNNDGQRKLQDEQMKQQFLQMEDLKKQQQFQEQQFKQPTKELQPQYYEDGEESEVGEINLPPKNFRNGKSIPQQDLLQDRKPNLNQLPQFGTGPKGGNEDNMPFKFDPKQMPDQNEQFDMEGMGLDEYFKQMDGTNGGNAPQETNKDIGNTRVPGWAQKTGN